MGMAIRYAAYRMREAQNACTECVEQRCDESKRVLQCREPACCCATIRHVYLRHFAYDTGTPARSMLQCKAPGSPQFKWKLIRFLLAGKTRATGLLAQVWPQPLPQVPAHSAPSSEQESLRREACS